MACYKLRYGAHAQNNKLLHYTESPKHTNTALYIDLILTSKHDRENDLEYMKPHLNITILKKQALLLDIIFSYFQCFHSIKNIL